MPKDTFKKLKVFIASPSDVGTERARLITVVEQLNHGLADYLGLILEIDEWSQVAPDMGRGQKVIFDQSPFNQWDIMVGILWLRYGMVSAGPNPEESGTHEEFNAAYECWQKTGKPRIMFYRCIRPPEDLTKIDTESLAKINTFFKAFETGGKNQGLYCTYNTTDNFERLVRDHLEKVLMAYVEKERGKTLTPQEIQVYVPSVPDTLPRRAPFFGRGTEIKKALRALDPEDRGWGIVIDGIGGIGKTALAVETAYLCKEEGSFQSFVFVSAKSDRLEPVGIQKIPFATTTLDNLINELARAIGQPGIAQLVSEKKGRALLDALYSTKTLIILDNLETLTGAEQNTVSDFLRNLPANCKAIVTSRHRTGEAAVTIRLGQLQWIDARQLIESEMSRHPDVERVFAQTSEISWRELYYAAGGSPLVLTWIMGLIRARKFSFSQALALLHDGSVESDLNSFIYRQTQILMDENEKTVLGTLSFFGDSASKEALSVIANIGAQALELALERLNTFSLVDIVERVDVQEHYTIHPLTKQFARADLRETITRYELGLRYAQYWGDYAKRHGGSRNNAYELYNQLEAEWANLNAALNWLWDEASVHDNIIKNTDAAGIIIEMELVLNYFLWSMGYWDDSILLTSRVYEIQTTNKDWQSARYLAFWLSFVCLGRNDIKSAEIWARRCIDVQRLDGDSTENPDLLFLMGQIAQRAKKYSKAKRSYDKVLELWQGGKKVNIVLILGHLGLLEIERQRHREAKGYYYKALDFAQDIDLESKETQPYFRNTLGRLALELGLYSDAHKWFDETILLAREVGNIEAVAQSQYGLACLLETEEQADLALTSALEALRIFERLQHKDFADARQLVERLKTKNKKQETGIN